MKTDTQSPDSPPLAGGAHGSGQERRLRFLATLDRLSESERRQLLRSETTEEIAELFTVGVNDYGHMSPVVDTLGAMLNARLVAEGQNAELRDRREDNQ